MKAVVQAVKDGPLRVTGEHAILRADGSLISRGEEAWLCRCGRSTNKPFCDGSHKSIPFVDDGSAGKNQAKATDRAGIAGPLNISLKANGPLRCAGEAEIKDASGRVLFAGSQTALCRCGASMNKPFCDGSHTAARFSAD